jgi:RNA polymerase sigma-70 factor, ECF subfamily
MSEASANTETGEVTAETDEQLMLAFGRGAASAFTELFARYKQPIFGFFRRRVADQAVAEELTQETFLAVVRAASRYEPMASFRTYLYAIALKILRAHRRRAAIRATFFGGAPTLREPAARESGDAEFVLRQALGKLDRVDREIWMLREFEELSYAEIAQLLRLPLNTVRSRLFRARMALREILTVPALRPAAGELARPEECV